MPETKTETEMGFTIHNRFYPLVRFEDWVWGDFSLSRKLTGISNDELLSTKADSMLLQQALITVAIWHARPELSHDQVVDYVWKLKPSEVDEVGFYVEEVEETDDEGDARPPDESESVNSNSSLSSSDESTDATPEVESQNDAGEPGLDTGSPELPLE